ncbi:hypothetical protein [Streptacidiphilus fuscans]|uniref:Secreted protein n=1 Tax=Streptacidiphilus fuscans TaxID=2789292 RepID=A0A931B4W9_9ACTN|nr:hypothetical protein [Streptacidiphilus fuscans]MBF9070271.1 hypothetical protein [Streptacidiphilus fuscans]
MNRVLRALPVLLLPFLVTACSSSGSSSPSAAAPSAGASSAPASSSAAAAAPAAACTQLPAGVLPHSAGELTEQQNGVYCLPKGGRVDVFLTAVKGSQWGQVQASGAQILAPANTGVMTAPLGVTPAMFVGTADGTAVLTSSTKAGQNWKVTLVVKG